MNDKPVKSFQELNKLTEKPKKRKVVNPSQTRKHVEAVNISRLALQLSQTDAAEMLSCGASSISRFINTGSAPRNLEVAAGYILENMELKRQQQEGEQVVGQAVPTTHASDDVEPPTEELPPVAFIAVVKVPNDHLSAFSEMMKAFKYDFTIFKV